MTHCVSDLTELVTLGEKMMDLLDMALSVSLVALFVPVAFGIYGKPRSEWSALLSMSLGFSVWFVLFLTEKVFCPAPGSFDGPYHEYASWEISELFGTVMIVPGKFYGFGFSLLGYFLGQRMGGGVPDPVVEEGAATDEHSSS